MDQTGTDTGRRRPRSAGRAVRWAASALICLLAAVTATAAIAAFYVRKELLDTDDFTERTAVLAQEPVVKDTIADLVVDAVADAIDVDRIAAEADEWIDDEAPPAQVRLLVESAAESLVARIEAEVREFLDGDRYPAVWDATVREAHASAVSALRDQDTGALTTDDTALILDLGRIAAEVKTHLTEADFAFADDIPEIDAEMVLVDSEQVPQAQRGTQTLETAALWLPWIAVALIVIGLALSPRRWTALLITSIAAAVLAAAAIIGIAFGRSAFLGGAPDERLSGVVYDAFTDDIRAAYLILLAVSLIAAVAALLVPRLRRRTRRAEPAG